MSIQITTWLTRLTSRCKRARGRARLHRARHRHDDVARWPRTTGADVIAIAAMIDPSRSRAAATRSAARPPAPLARVRRRRRAPSRSPALGEPIRENRDVLGMPRRRSSSTCRRSARRCRTAGDVGRAARRARRRARSSATSDRRATARSSTSTTSRRFDDLYLAQFIYLRELRGVDRHEARARA